MEVIKKICFVCDTNEFKIFASNFYLLNGNKYDLIKCNSCGIIIVNPFPNPQELMSMYDSKYFNDCYDSGISNKGYFENVEFMTRRYEHLISKITKFKNTGKILEIGCAGGLFLNIAKQSGFEIFGVELSKDISISENLKENIFIGTLEEANFSTDYFDIIYMGHVLEHISTPIETILEVKRILKPSGILIIEVPSFVNSFYYDVLKRFYKLFNIKPPSMFKIETEGKYLKPYHLIEFSPYTIKRFLIKLGFEYVQIEQDIPLPDIVLKKPDNIKEFLIKTLFLSLNMLTKIKFRGGQLRIYVKNK